MRLRIIANIGVKICYLVVDIVVFLATDILLNGDFRQYGMNGYPGAGYQMKSLTIILAHGI